MGTAREHENYKGAAREGQIDDDHADHELDDHEPDTHDHDPVILSVSSSPVTALMTEKRKSSVHRKNCCVHFNSVYRDP